MQHFSCFFIYGFTVKRVHLFIAYKTGNFLLHGNGRAGNNDCVQGVMAVVFRTHFAQSPKAAQQIGNLSVGCKDTSFPFTCQLHMVGNKLAQETVDVARIVQIAFFKAVFVEFLQQNPLFFTARETAGFNTRFKFLPFSAVVFAVEVFVRGLIAFVLVFAAQYQHFIVETVVPCARERQGMVDFDIAFFVQTA